MRPLTDTQRELLIAALELARGAWDEDPENAQLDPLFDDLVRARASDNVSFIGAWSAESAAQFERIEARFDRVEAHMDRQGESIATLIREVIKLRDDGCLVAEVTGDTRQAAMNDPDVVSTQTRAILDAMAPHEWWRTEDPSVVVISLDGTTAIRLTVAGAALPDKSPYDTDDNLYPGERDE